MSWVNLVEVYYALSRRRGPRVAAETLAVLESAVVADVPDRELMLRVGELKAEHPIALGDCFAVATAARHRATLLTGDPELLDRAGGLPCPLEDLR